MSIANSEVNDELNYYNKIIDCFHKHQNDDLKREICKNKSIVRLMRSIKYKKKNDFIKNSLIFVLSLFDNEDLPPDLYTNIGNDIKNTTDKEQKEIISELKKEFLS